MELETPAKASTPDSLVEESPKKPPLTPIEVPKKKTTKKATTKKVTTKKVTTTTKKKKTNDETAKPKKSTQELKQIKSSKTNTPKIKERGGNTEEKPKLVNKRPSRKSKTNPRMINSKKLSVIPEVPEV